MPAGPPDLDPLAGFRAGRLGPFVTAPGDYRGLLAAVAEALNTCERHGLIVDLERDGAITSRGYVLPVGDSRLGSRWVVRSRLEADEQRQAGPGAPEGTQ